MSSDRCQPRAGKILPGPGLVVTILLWRSLPAPGSLFGDTPELVLLSCQVTMR